MKPAFETAVVAAAIVIPIQLAILALFLREILKALQ